MQEYIGIVGAGNQGVVVHDMLRRQRRRVCGFLDDAYPYGDVSKRILGDTSLITSGSYGEINCLIVAIGNNVARESKFYELSAHLPMINVVDDFAHVSKWAKLPGKTGLMVHPLSCIGPDSSISMDTIINTGAIVEHDVDIGKHVHLAPGAIVLGRAHVEDGAFIGGGAVIRDGLTVGKWAMVGMGSVVTRDVPEGEKWYGNPAKEVKR